MTDRITIEGQDLTITHDQANRDPKRKRPERFAPSPVSADYRSIEDLISTGNPFWSDEANDAADASTLPPKVLAKQWAGRRVMTKTAGYARNEGDDG